MRIDTPSSSIISNPTDQNTILLDHLKKEATIIPMPAASGVAAPASSKLPGGAPPPPALQVQDLGKGMIEGHEVEGKRYVLPAAQKPPAPALAKMPQMPKSAQVHGSPNSPALPKAPPLPKAAQPTVTEVWISTKLKTPVLTKITSALGSQTTYCKPTSTQEPHSSMFEIPPGYKLKSS
jgi:hypothetical protein